MNDIELFYENSKKDKKKTLAVSCLSLVTGLMVHLSIVDALNNTDSILILLFGFFIVILIIPVVMLYSSFIILTPLVIFSRLLNYEIQLTNNWMVLTFFGKTTKYNALSIEGISVRKNSNKLALSRVIIKFDTKDKVKFYIKEIDKFEEIINLFIRRNIGIKKETTSRE